MTTMTTALHCSSVDATTRIAAALGAVINTGETILLSGPVGAGKTHFARSLIQSVQTVPEDIPSPTFTLVQTYDTMRGPLWHADLYRIGDSAELEELGLLDAFDDAICLIEWPDRLGDLKPALALSIVISVTGEGARDLTLTGDRGHWATRITRLGRNL